MNTKEKKIAVLKALEYLIAEGMVVEEEGNYRLKTKKEQKAELEIILNERD